MPSVHSSSNVNYSYQPPSGPYALHDAVLNNSRMAAAVLIRQGVRTDVKNQEGNTPLHIAAELGRGGLLVDLIGNGTPHAALIVNNLGETPLHVAAKTNNAQCVRVLLDHVSAADLGLLREARDGQGRSAMELAEYLGNNECRDAIANYGLLSPEAMALLQSFFSSLSNSQGN